MNYIGFIVTFNDIKSNHKQLEYRQLVFLLIPILSFKKLKKVKKD